MSEENKALVHRWFEEVWNKGREEAIDEMLAADAVVHGLSDEGDQPFRGPADFHGFHRKFREAFPDIIVTVEDAIAEDDKVAVRCTARGNHKGDSLGFAATNNLMLITGIAIARIKDGKIVEAWNNFDFMTMYRQLGVR